MSLGFRDTGFDIVKAIDSERAAVDTYASNIGDHVVHDEVSLTTSLPRATVFIGGPPCQGFSSAGLRRHEDQRNTLVGCYAALIAKYRPSAFVFENVEGFLTTEEANRVLELLEPLVDAGYRIHLQKINAAAYGVPQHRKRVIAIGGLGWNPSFPTATHCAYGAPGTRLGATIRPGTPTLDEALTGLPLPIASYDKNQFDHYYSVLSGTDLLRARALKPGETMRDLPEHLWHQSYQRRAFRRVMDGTPSQKRGGGRRQALDG